jgi:hypothetical protein
MRRFSAPVRFSSTAYCPARPNGLGTLWLLHHVHAEHPGGAGVGVEQRGEYADARRLAGTVRAEQSQHLAHRYLEGDAVERVHVAEVLDQPVGLDRRIHAVGSSLARCDDRGGRRLLLSVGNGCRANVSQAAITSTTPCMPYW